MYQVIVGANCIAPSRQGMGMTGPPMRKLFIYTVQTGLLMTGLVFSRAI